MEQTKSKLELSQIKSKCLRLLTKRDHSVLEMRQKLRRYYEFSADDFTAAVEWLRELKYLVTDDVLAEKWAAQYRKMGRGRQWIAAKLRTKGLRLNLGDGDEEKQALQTALEKKLRGRSVKDLDFKDRQRLGRQLTSRGFSVSLVRELLK